MRNLQLLAEGGIRTQVPYRGLRLTAAFGIAVMAVMLAFLGLMWRYPSADVSAPLPGMNHWVGQLGWSFLLGVLMVAAAWLVRGVMMARLQRAIVLSLAIHLLLLQTTQLMHLDFRLVQNVEAEDELSSRSAEELTIPDYGGQESPQVEQQVWQRPQDTLQLQTQQAELQRQQIEHDAVNEPKQMEVESRVDVRQAEQMQRKEAEARLKNERSELARAMLEQPNANQAPEQVPVPELKAESNREPKLEAQSEERSRTSLPEAHKEQQQRQSRQSQQSMNSVALKAKRSEATLEESKPAETQLDRAVALARAVEIPAQSPNITSAQPSRPRSEIPIAETETEISRRAQTSLPQRNQSSDSAPSQSRSSSSLTTAARRAARAQNNRLLQSTPSSGGAVAMNRAAQSNALSAAAVAGSAGSVEVAAAQGARGPAISESQASGVGRNGVGRPTASISSVSAGGRSGSPRTSAAGVGSAALPQAATGNRSAGQPRLSDGASGLSLARAASMGTSTSAAGVDAGQVALPSSSGGGGANRGGANSPLGHDPSGTQVARRSSGLPARTGTGGSGLSGIGSPSSSTGQLRGIASGSSGSRSAGPNARLDDARSLSGTLGGGTASRAALTSGLPEGALMAEQAGNLVAAGPQAGPSSMAGSGLSGPRRNSLPRRLAGLPGVGNLGGATGSVGGLPRSGGLTASTTGARRATQAGLPSLEKQKRLSGLVKQSVGTAAAAGVAKSSPGFSQRQPGIRKQIAETMGGTKESEAAVELGLKWLASHQHPDGHWSIHDFDSQCKGHQCTGVGSFQSDSAATGLALLAFYGAGYTHQADKYQKPVAAGLNWLLQHQKKNGDLFDGSAEFVWFYSHGIAAIALCEAYGMTHDTKLRQPVQAALDFIVESQHPEFGGWRYKPQFESDTSVSGWQVMALKSGELAGLEVPRNVYSGVTRWLNLATSKSAQGLFAYHPSRPATLAMTAEGLLMRQYLGASRGDTDLLAGGDHLRKHLPVNAERDVYYWYYATQVMFHLQGEFWDEWNTRMRDLLVSSQRKTGDSVGSWSPDLPTEDKWSSAGGRHYTTCMNLLILEVYYRHLPLYLQLK